MLTVPEIQGDRYDWIQFIAAYTFNFAYLRIYWPEAAALDGTWTAPKLEMVK